MRSGETQLYGAVCVSVPKGPSGARGRQCSNLLLRGCVNRGDLSPPFGFKLRIFIPGNLYLLRPNRKIPLLYLSTQLWIYF